MAKQETKQRILEKAADIIHHKGFNHTGIQEVLQAAGVPKGSFYFHFKSKEDFGLQLLDHFDGHFVNGLQAFRQRTDLTPLQQLRQFLLTFIPYFEEKDFKGGCPIGNFAQEMGDTDEVFRVKTEEIWNRMRDAVRDCLADARQQGELSAESDPAQLAEFIMNSWEGALTRMKVTRSSEPLKLFDKMVFEQVLPEAG